MGREDETGVANYDEEQVESRRKPKGSKFGYFLSALAGVLIGALLVMTVVQKTDTDTGETGTIDSGQTNGEIQNVTQNVTLNASSAVIDAVEKTSDAVVGITNIQQTSFWGEQGDTAEAGSGSGVVYKKAGDKAYIVTNNHVIENANKLEVTLADGTKLEAGVKGSDPWTDLAVVEVDGSKVKTVAEFGKSEALKAGEQVIAIGNPLGLQFSGSITQGVISGLERTVEVDIDEDGQVDWNAEVLQTDAAINPGNSGGALVNMKGQVIGINSMKIAENAVEGIGLSIPIDSAIPIISDIEKYGKVKRPYLGVSLASVEEISQYHQKNTLKLPNDVTAGVAITSVEPNSPAARAGLKEFDVIVKMDGEAIKDVASLRKYLYNKKEIGNTVKITVYRGGKQQTIELKLSESQDL